jgi:hypothetical protein
MAGATKSELWQPKLAATPALDPRRRKFSEHAQPDEDAFTRKSGAAGALHVRQVASAMAG